MSEQPDSERSDEIPATGPNEAKNRPDEDDVDPAGREDAG